MRRSVRAFDQGNGALRATRVVGGIRSSKCSERPGESQSRRKESPVCAARRSRTTGPAACAGPRHPWRPAQASTPSERRPGVTRPRRRQQRGQLADRAADHLTERAWVAHSWGGLSGGPSTRRPADAAHEAWTCADAGPRGSGWSDRLCTQVPSARPGWSLEPLNAPPRRARPARRRSRTALLYQYRGPCSTETEIYVSAMKQPVCTG